MIETTLYRNARQLVRNGDMGILRNGGMLGANSPNDATHALLFLWTFGVLEVFESREFLGAHQVSFSSQVGKYPGLIDIYRPNCDPHVAQVAAGWAAKMEGHKYGYFDWVRTAFRRVGGYPRAKTDTTLGEFHEPKDCSAAVTWCYRAGQRDVEHELGHLAPDEWDPVPGINEHFVEPYMLAESGSFRLIARGVIHAPDLKLLEVA